MSRYKNPNPRVGVLLAHNFATARLYNCLNPKYGRQGVKRFCAEHPIGKSSSAPGERWIDVLSMGHHSILEWMRILKKTGHAHHLKFKKS